MREIAVRQSHTIINTPKGCTKRVTSSGETTTRSGVGLEHDHRFVGRLSNRRGVQELVEHTPAGVSTVVCKEVDVFVLVVVGRTTTSIDGETIVGGITAKHG